MDLIQIYLKNSNELTIITLPVPISLHFCCFYVKNFPWWILICILNADPDLDLGEKMNADPCGSGSTTLVKLKWDPPPLPMQFSSKNILFCNNLYKVFFLFSEKGICLPTVFLWLLFVYIEVSGLSQSFLLYDSFFIKY